SSAWPSSTGRSAAIVSIASRAWSCSSPSSFAYASWPRVDTVETTSVSIFSARSCSAICSALTSSSATDRLSGRDLLRVDLLQAHALPEARALALGRVRRGNGEELRRAELLGDGLHPFDQPLDVRPRRTNLARREVDQLAGEAVADRPPQVLLDQAVRQQDDRLAV